MLIGLPGTEEDGEAGERTHPPSSDYMPPHHHRGYSATLAVIVNEKATCIFQGPTSLKIGPPGAGPRVCSHLEQSLSNGSFCAGFSPDPFPPLYSFFSVVLA